MYVIICTLYLFISSYLTTSGYVQYDMYHSLLITVSVYQFAIAMISHLTQSYRICKIVNTSVYIRGNDILKPDCYAYLSDVGYNIGKSVIFLYL